MSDTIHDLLDRMEEDENPNWIIENEYDPWGDDEWDDPEWQCCVDCGRIGYLECDVCGLPLCGMCAELGLNVCRDCREHGRHL